MQGDNETLIRHDERISQILIIVNTIKNELKTHTDWELGKYDSISKQIKEGDRDSYNKIEKIEKEIKESYAGIWVESWVKGVAFATILMFIGAVITAILSSVNG